MATILLPKCSSENSTSWDGRKAGASADNYFLAVPYSLRVAERGLFGRHIIAPNVTSADTDRGTSLA
jgi:hypothetical protein